MEHVCDIIEETTSATICPISTGFKFLDTIIGGYYPGELTTICGEEDCGKTAYVISQLNHQRDHSFLVWLHIIVQLRHIM